MERIRIIEGRVAPLPHVNVDTDQIIPATYLKVIDKAGLGEGLFANWRWRNGRVGDPDPSFVLNRPEHEGATILLAGDNFGCGSSREHAPWALLAGGFRAVLSTGFADIFRSNALKNGLLVVELDPAASERLFAAVAEDPTIRVAIDLETRTVALPDGSTVSFEIDPFARRCLLDGVDPLGYLLDRLPEIEAWERAQATAG
ncbi:MAG TPA: 3-isopropylmalate dehydratase small subunit [Thermoanaerobaculia bacterium]|nr:3-isopropylmalate dehydratase small subunit [Thermoanaerobaculia bacterium]